jgi:hypothetical protein
VADNVNVKVGEAVSVDEEVDVKVAVGVVVGEIVLVVV